MVENRLSELRSEFKGKKVILGVDRLDYIKGVPNKLAAFMRFLDKYPEHSKDTVLIQIAVPTRQEIEEYTELRQLVYTTAGRCNAVHGTADFSPCQVTYGAISFTELSSLYQLADICLVTSLRDGMNLVSLEYIASQYTSNGVLIISEFAGASQSLSEAISINPWDADDVAEKIFLSLNMKEDERKIRHEQLFSYAKKHQSGEWATSFVRKLHDIGPTETISPKCLYLLDDQAKQVLEHLEDLKAGHLFHYISKSEMMPSPAQPCFVDFSMDCLRTFLQLPGTIFEVKRNEISLKFDFGDYGMWKLILDEMVCSLQAREDSENYQVSDQCKTGQQLT